MDGTYNNPFAQGQSPSTPDTPSGGTYQVNVNRTKTRKWVEAKVQSYDGDDWGADEFDDDDEEPEPIPPVPRVTTGLRPVGQRLPSETLRSSPRLPAPVPSGSRSASGPPALHLQTGNTEEDHATPPIPHIPVHVQDTPRSTPSPVSGRNASPVPLPSQTAPPIASHPADARSSTPQSTVSSTPARSSPLTRPTEPAQRAEQEGKLADSQPTSNAGEVRQSQETLQRKESTQHYPELDLPDVGQVSFLDSSFLSGSKKDETESSDKAAADEPTIGLKSQAPVLLPMPDSQPIQPLRTPSPQVKDTVLPTESHHAASHQKTSAAGIIPTEPLQPRRPEHSPSDYEPQPIQREPTMSTITSSPVKENDVLSDEIMRSLGPSGVAPTIGPVGDTPSALALKSNTDPRDSSYTLSDYDSYWADGKEKPVAGEKNVESTTTPSQNTAQGSQETIPQNSASPDVSNDAPKEGDDDSGSRRRFSWEAIKAQPPANVPPKSNLPGTNDPPPPSQPDTQSTKDVLADVTSTRAETPKIVIPSESEPSSVPASQPLPSMLEPSSPVSTRTDESAMYGIENRRPSLVEEKMLAEPPTISESPPSDTQSVTSSTPTTKTGQMPQVMGLKEIMGLPTSSQRLSQYEESQQAFAVVELGLKNWIQSLKTQHPEYANASSSFGGVSYQASTSGVNATSSSGLAPTQQPYYQQYLNASSPTTTTPSTSRSRLGGLPLSTQAATSAFGNSGNQIGTKSKEFMHSAGKMGKGLFSKGRSKLRGTGDKVFH